MEECVLSIAMMTYNHAKYIRQALDSVLMQNIECEYEIVIGDDCSSDETQKIIKEYSSKYPNKIQPILRKKT